MLDTLKECALTTLVVLSCLAIALCGAVAMLKFGPVPDYITWPVFALALIGANFPFCRSQS